VLFVIADPRSGRSAAPEINDPTTPRRSWNSPTCTTGITCKIRTDRLSDAHVDFYRGLRRVSVGNDLFGPSPDCVEIVWSGRSSVPSPDRARSAHSLGLSEDKGRPSTTDHIVARLVYLIEWLRGYDGPMPRETGEC